MHLRRSGAVEEIGECKGNIENSASNGTLHKTFSGTGKNDLPFWRQATGGAQFLAYETFCLLAAFKENDTMIVLQVRSGGVLDIRG